MEKKKRGKGGWIVENVHAEVRPGRCWSGGHPDRRWKCAVRYMTPIHKLVDDVQIKRSFYVAA